MASLFLRMRLVHWIGMALLLVNALAFTDNTVSRVIQFVLIAVLIVHDIDEKRWGVDALSAIARYFQHFADKDLSVKCDVNTSLNAEMGDMVSTIDQFREEIRGALVDIKQVADTNQNVAKKLTDTSKTMGQRITQEVAAVSRAKQYMQEMQGLSQAVTQRADQTNIQVTGANQQLQASRQNIGTMAEMVDEHVRASNDITENFAKLSENALKIKDVLAVINGIADQTNLLALNAAIEAARAGEHGRGFSVVADEVRGLSQSTQNSLTEINEIISAITSAIDLAGKKVEHQKSSLEALKITSSEAADVIVSACDVMQEVAELTGQRSQQGNSNIHSINKKVEEVLVEVDQLAVSTGMSEKDIGYLLTIANDLSATVDSLRNKVAVFKT
ncbi:methyl-accepting chemotaxis protein [Simiduia curdlanivorans]|uniref:Methyl-accepting chemotaxis protein n=1 Tax=Simiduia curdlanivorans TaxID=1492769 RepID=A0ABV8V2R2_9GAMM|nr:methyl-accepting chemotaxis protein [Simiduia curdlanivorans]MDN3641012.1 methyl-accepting chemotaxis protein [Simiduia curdlanivorans]